MFSNRKLVRRVHSAFGTIPIASLVLLSSCYEERVGPEVDEPEEASNPCLDLTSSQRESASPEGILDVFDCLNSEGAYNNFRSPLEYLVYTQFTEALSQQEMGYLDPYFYILDYSGPLNLEENVQGGDLIQTIEALDQLLNDPDEPLKALLDLYVETYQQGYLQNGMHFAQIYSEYLYTHCTTANCPLIDLANDLESLPAVQTLADNKAYVNALVDPYLQDSINHDMIELARAAGQEASESGENLLFGLLEAFSIHALEDDPSTSVDDPYVGKTFLEAAQRPLCQLISDRRGEADLAANPNAPKETLDVMMAMSGQMYVNGQLDYLPLNLRTLTNYHPSGVPVTTTQPSKADTDYDGFSISDGDCNDADAEVYPGATEVIDDLKDNDCDLVPDDPVSSDYHYAADYSCDRNQDGVEDECGEGAYDPDCDSDCDGVSPNYGDCDDTNAAVHPGLKIYGSNGSITVIDAAEEFPDGQEDLMDNDCDGFTDHTASSLEIILTTVDMALPMTYEIAEGTSTYLDVMVETLASQPTALDVEELLTANEELIETTVSNLSNGTIPPDITARVRVMLPVVYKLADLGLLSPESMASVLAIADDHEAYQNAYQESVDTSNDTELDKFRQYSEACGEEWDNYVDSLKVLDELVTVLDIYDVINEPNLNELIPIIVNSDMLVHQLEVSELSLDENGEKDPAVTAATIEMADYFLKPPSDSGLYFDNYSAAKLWLLMPMLELLYEDPARIDQLDELMMYAINGMEDPTSVLSAVNDAMEVLAQLDTGGQVNKDALIEILLSSDPKARRILINFLAIAADPYFPMILSGEWDALPTDLREKYQTEKSTFQVLDEWIEDGIVDGFIDMAGNLLSWIVENTTIGDTDEDEMDPEPAENTPVTE